MDTASCERLLRLWDRQEFVKQVEFADKQVTFGDCVLMNDEEEILLYFERDPTKSIYMFVDRLRIPHWKVWFTPVQVNEKGDPLRRLDFGRSLHDAELENHIILPKCCG